MDALKHSEPARSELDRARLGQRAEAPPDGSDERAAKPPEASSAATVYDLRLGGGRSDQYYADASRFSDLFLDEAELCAASLLDGYGRHVREVLREAPRSRSEHAVEFLMLGLLLQVYGDAAESTPSWAVELRRELLWLRQRSAAIKPFADFGRAVLGSLFISPGRSCSGSSGAPSPDRVPRLIEWLSASGEFTQEAMRINNWRGYLATLPAGEAAGWLGESVALFDWFRREAEAALGTYTKGVSEYLANEAPLHRRSEDRLLCSRSAVEYQAGMVAAEVMNRGMRREFQETSRRVVLVPTCMRAKPNGCRAKMVGFDLVCTGCNTNCNVHQMTRRMRSQGATVYLLPHSSSFSRWLARWHGNPDLGVIAVACLANIVAGGFEMRARGITSQCVLLDFPGCQRHWSREGFPTEANVERLVQIATMQAPDERET